MNYRHAFHAGNFADLVKHATLLRVLSRMVSAPGPLTVIDTHAGRGIYDLTGVEARKSGEAEAGIVRLMAVREAPEVFRPLAQAMVKLNGGARASRYPGSPWLIAEALGPSDRYLACELRPEEHAALRALMKARPAVETLCADGYDTAAGRTPAAGKALILIDPPFERPDDYRRIVETLIAIRRRNRQAVALVWLPLKDLETFDAFLRDLEAARLGPAMAGEARMRPLTDPMKMNGCALVLLGPPAGMAEDFETICSWAAANLGESGEGRVYALSS